MAKTPDTSATSYASGADMVVRYNVRKLGQVLSDSGTAVAANAVAGDATLAALLLDASGVVESAAVAGGRYQSADLAALTGAGRAFLKRLVCGLAMWAASLRVDPEMKRPAWAKELDDTLDKLRLGERVFPFVETEDAGLPELVSETSTATRPTLSDDYRRVFGTRRRSLPFPR